MKVIIAGSRSITNKFVCMKILDDLLSDIPYEYLGPLNDGKVEVVCGMAEGPDLFGKEWAKNNNIPVKEFPVKWHDESGNYNKAAGIWRNEKMGNYADALIAFWDGASRGTKHMIDYALKRGLEVHVYRVD